MLIDGHKVIFLPLRNYGEPYLLYRTFLPIEKPTKEKVQTNANAIII